MKESRAKETGEPGQRERSLFDEMLSWLRLLCECHHNDSEFSPFFSESLSPVQMANKQGQNETCRWM